MSEFFPFKTKHTVPFLNVIDLATTYTLPHSFVKYIVHFFVYNGPVLLCQRANQSTTNFTMKLKGLYMITPPPDVSISRCCCFQVRRMTHFSDKAIVDINFAAGPVLPLVSHFEYTRCYCSLYVADLWHKMTYSTTPEVHNALHWLIDWLIATPSEHTTTVTDNTRLNLVKFEHLVFEICSTDRERQTDTQTQIRSSQYFAPLLGAE